jgi:Tol biopolymer transport system component
MLHLARLPILIRTVAALTLVAAAAIPAAAQYFGQNKVQYGQHKHEVLKTEHFDIYYYPEEHVAVQHAARMAERWYARLSKLLHHHLEGRQALILYASHPDFEQTNVLDGSLGEGTGGVTEALKRRIIIPFAGPLAETDHVLGHELVHAFQYDEGGLGKGAYNSPIERLPLWFIEGMAEYLSLGPVDPHTAMWMREAAQRDTLPRVKDLDRSRYFPYRYGQALWAYIGGRWGDDAIGQCLRVASRSGDGIGAIEKVTEIKEEDLSKSWQISVKIAYAEAAAEHKPASEYGRALLTEKSGGRLNVGPALSADGRYIAFLSERGLFSIDLYIADTKTGKVTRKLTSTASDPHYDSLQFINSAGAWDASGRRFVFPGVSKGRALLTVVDVASGKAVQEIPLREVDEVFHPTWSPDGRQIAFTGQKGGLTDLYVYDFDTKRVRGLTDDDYADLEPAWSPDGRTIAFVTDRFSSDLTAEHFGNYRLALLDVQSGDVQPLPSFPEAKNINPQWGKNGQELFFLSDRGGITNIYRLDPASREIHAVTNLVLGVSGITATSPSLSVAVGAPTLAFSAYEAESYRIYLVDKPETLAGTRVDPGLEVAAAAALPPPDRQPSLVAAARGDDQMGLPEPQAFPKENYRARLGLDYVAQPYLAVGADRFGAFAGGGTSLFFSDMLGDHSLVLSVQGDGRFRTVTDFSALVGYENRTSRLNWGLVAEQIPLDTAGLSVSTALRNGVPVEVDETILFRETHRVAGLVLSYPFNRAERLEVMADYRNISFRAEKTTDIFSLASGDQIDQVVEDIPAVSGLNLGELTAAFVHDTSVFGATSPVLGKRYRLEVSPSSGTITYTGLLADYRAYFMPVRPFTFAFRALHYGRYGSGAEDKRFAPLFLGYPNLVRGYDVGSFKASECGANANTNTCPVFDQLFGSKLALGNAEVRFPLLGAFTGARNFYGPIPIEAAIFADTGIAWTDAEKPRFLSDSGTRRFVSSVGAALRANVLGFFIAEIDYAHPMDRPQRRWVWAFSVTPGF